LGFRRSI